MGAVYALHPRYFLVQAFVTHDTVHRIGYKSTVGRTAPAVLPENVFYDFVRIAAFHKYAFQSLHYGFGLRTVYFSRFLFRHLR